MNQQTYRPLLDPAWLDARRAPLFDENRQTWFVFAYDDACRVIANPNEFSQEYGRPDDHPTYAAAWAADGPRHEALRNIVEHPFARPKLAAWAPRIRAIADDLLACVLARKSGEIELAADFTLPFATRVMFLVLGMDLTADEAAVLHWIDEQSHAASTGGIVRQPELVSYLMDRLDGLRRQPTSGLACEALLRQEQGYTVEGKPLSDRDLLGYLWSLLSGGIETVDTALSSMLLTLLEFEVLDQLRAAPQLIPTAIEETLRWMPPMPEIPLVAKTDLEMAGQRIGAGQVVTAWIPAANRDPAVFPEHGRFDIRRLPNPHLSAGWGRHYCPGVPLARLEMRIALEAILDKLPRLQRDAERMPVYRSGMIYRISQAYCRFS